MRALLLLSIIGLFTPQGPKELWLQGERARAITALSAELEESESPTGRQQLVEWCLAVHRYRAALDEAEKMGDAGAALRGRARYFLGEYEAALVLLPVSDGESALMRVEALRALGHDWAAPLEAAAKLLSAEDARIVTLRAVLLLEEGKHALAIPAFERALEGAPLQVEAMFGLGRALVKSGDRERGLAVLKRHRELTPLIDALDFARRGLDLAPTHGPNHAALGDAWRALIPYDPSAYESSEAAYLTALSHAASGARVPIHLRRARLVAEHGRGALEAAKILDGVFEELEDVRLLVRAADLYIEGGEKWEGVERLERALALRPDDKEIERRLIEAAGYE